MAIGTKQHIFRLTPFLLIFLAMILPVIVSVRSFAAETAPVPVKQGDILPFLEQLIVWRKAATDIEPSAESGREGLLKEQLRQTSKSVLQKGFAFARAQADILEAAPKEKTDAATPANPESRHSRLLKAAAEADKAVEDLQQQLGEGNLKAGEREQKAGELKLAKARQELLQTMMTIFTADSENSGTLADQVNSLARTVLTDTAENAAAVKEPAESKSAPAKDTDNASQNEGMLNLSSALLTLSRRKDSVTNLINQTTKLDESAKNMIASVRASLKAALAEGNALTAQNVTNKSLADYRKSIDQLIVRYKHLGATIIPLGQMSILIDSANVSLQEWNRLVGDNWSRLFHQLLLRLTVLCVSVAVPLFISSLARRATQHYVTDVKRQKQLRILRRVVLGATLTFVILANFITEFGSLATFAGFITAGLAVALQTVLISLVAHFLFFGRYGVRAGDRVTVSDVTGDVVQIGILRMYIRELKESEQGLLPTGKIVAFPNSILFQPTAFYKHMHQ